MFFIQMDVIGGPHQGLGASIRLAPALKEREEGRGEKGSGIPLSK